MDTTHFTEADNGKIIQAKVGDVVTITLQWKPSNGYFWQEGNTEAGSLIGIKHDGDNPLPGGSVYVTFKFRIVKSGKIELDLARPWAETEPPAKWFAITVSVS